MDTEARLPPAMSCVPLAIESEIKMGSALMTSSRKMKPTSSAGLSAMAVRSIFAPETTKNSGMKKPCAMPISLGSSVSLSSGTR